MQYVNEKRGEINSVLSLATAPTLFEAPRPNIRALKPGFWNKNDNVNHARFENRDRCCVVRLSRNGQKFDSFFWAYTNATVTTYEGGTNDSRYNIDFCRSIYPALRRGVAHRVRIVLRPILCFNVSFLFVTDVSSTKNNTFYPTVYYIRSTIENLPKFDLIFLYNLNSN